VISCRHLGVRTCLCGQTHCLRYSRLRARALGSFLGTPPTAFHGLVSGTARPADVEALASVPLPLIFGRSEAGFSDGY
jgi:hypothetical protein